MGVLHHSPLRCVISELVSALNWTLLNNRFGSFFADFCARITPQRIHSIHSSIQFQSISSCHRRWLDTPHPFGVCSHTFHPSHAICIFLDLQPGFLHTLFYLPPPCHFWPSSLLLRIHFQHHCLLLY